MQADNISEHPLTEIVNIDQFYELFYTSKQKYIGYGLCWYFIQELHFMSVSDYSYQDLLEIEEKHPGFIRSWLLHAIVKIIKHRKEYGKHEFIEFLLKSIRNTERSTYPEVVARILFERLMKILRGARTRYNLDVYSAAGRVLRNYFVNGRLEFHKNNLNKRYDYGEFLHDGGLHKCVDYIRNTRNIRLIAVDWGTPDDEISIDEIITRLNEKIIYKQFLCTIDSQTNIKDSCYVEYLTEHMNAHKQ